MKKKTGYSLAELAINASIKDPKKRKAMMRLVDERHSILEAARSMLDRSRAENENPPVFVPVAFKVDLQSFSTERLEDLMNRVKQVLKRRKAK